MKIKIQNERGNLLNNRDFKIQQKRHSVKQFTYIFENLEEMNTFLGYKMRKRHQKIENLSEQIELMNFKWQLKNKLISPSLGAPGLYGFTPELFKSSNSN